MLKLILDHKYFSNIIIIVTTLLSLL